jgi:hypothetical protein
MKFTTEEAYDDETITMTKGAVAKTLRSHQMSLDEMVVDLGDRAEYPAHEVLNWMGY